MAGEARTAMLWQQGIDESMQRAFAPVNNLMSLKIEDALRRQAAEESRVARQQEIEDKVRLEARLVGVKVDNEDGTPRTIEEIGVEMRDLAEDYKSLAELGDWLRKAGYDTTGMDLQQMQALRDQLSQKAVGLMAGVEETLTTMQQQIERMATPDPVELARRIGLTEDEVKRVQGGTSIQQVIGGRPNEDERKDLAERLEEEDVAMRKAIADNSMTRERLAVLNAQLRQAQENYQTYRQIATAKDIVGQADAVLRRAEGAQGGAQGGQQRSAEEEAKAKEEFMNSLAGGDTAAGAGATATAAGSEEGSLIPAAALTTAGLGYLARNQLAQAAAPFASAPIRAALSAAPPPVPGPGGAIQVSPTRWVSPGGVAQGVSAPGSGAILRSAVPGAIRAMAGGARAAAGAASMPLLAGDLANMTVRAANPWMADAQDQAGVWGFGAPLWGINQLRQVPIRGIGWLQEAALNGQLPDQPFMDRMAGLPAY
jgi:hypothetical protein